VQFFTFPFCTHPDAVRLAVRACYSKCTPFAIWHSAFRCSTISDCTGELACLRSARVPPFVPAYAWWLT
jgi:hypothetical protein